MKLSLTVNLPPSPRCEDCLHPHPAGMDCSAWMDKLQAVLDSIQENYGHSYMAWGYDDVPHRGSS